MTDVSRYLIGIDLGTTNSAVAYVDCCPKKNPSLAVQSFMLPQIFSEAVVDTAKVLPSFMYLAREGEFPEEALTLPWDTYPRRIVGQFAKERGARVPTQLVFSAKSWLCNAAAARRDALLPVTAQDPKDRISPVEASAAYLSHIRQAWNHVIAKGDPDKEFEQQDIVLTVPASFDEVARTLTVEAAQQAGFRHVSLLEEPQAAFYSWIQEQGDAWKERLCVGEQVLVCDIGGGTSDFSLIEVVEEEGGKGFQRMAVGRHLLLGGDNIDAFVAHHLEKQLDRELSASQYLELSAHARRAKEVLVDGSDERNYRATIQGQGASLVAESFTVEARAAELRSAILDGFFKHEPWEEATVLAKSRGMRSMGLPYEDDPAITKQLAHFLKQQGGDKKGPDYVLFNGGTMKARCFQRAVLESLELWFGRKAQLLSSQCLDLAVCRGAAFYGKVRRGLGVRIGGGSPRAYYLAIAVKEANKTKTNQALTIVSRGRDEGYQHVVEQDFLLMTNQAVSFQLYSSQVRLHDVEGERIPIDEEELSVLPQIQTVLRYGKKQQQIPVRLRVSMTEWGTLELWLQSCKSSHQWKLEYQLRRSGGQHDDLSDLDCARQDETWDGGHVVDAQNYLNKCLCAQGYKPTQVMKGLEDVLGLRRQDWPPSVLRALADTLLKVASRRRASKEHEGRFWNLLGFFLRPGRGYPLDDHRIKALWKLWLEDGAVKKDSEVACQRWICLRRVAAGLSKGQQRQLASQLAGELLDKKRRAISLVKGEGRQIYAEKLRCFAAMERASLDLKVAMGDALLDRIVRGKGERSDYWALARIGARQQLFASVADVVPRERCMEWVDRLLEVYDKEPKEMSFVLTQLARKTELRHIDLPSSLTDLVYARCQTSSTHERLRDLLYHSVQLSREEQGNLLGDALPAGLSWEIDEGS